VTTAEPPSPGDLLRHLMVSDQRVTQEQLATAMGVTRYSVNQLVNGRRSLTADMALRLARATGTTPALWLNLQRELDLYKARVRLGSRLNAIVPIRPPVPDNELFYRGPK
jgi:antitoxin HigA-1